MSSVECVYSQPRKRGPQRTRPQGSRESLDTVPRASLHPVSPISTPEITQTAQTDSTPSVDQPAQDLHLLQAHPTTTFADHHDISPVQEILHTPSATIDLPITLTCNPYINPDNRLSLELANLCQAVQETGIAEPVEDIMNRCIDAFIAYLYPLAPLIHEASMRASIDVFYALRSGHEHAYPTRALQYNLEPGPSDVSPEVIKTIAYLIALCAEVGWMLPPALCPYPYGTTLAPIFLRTSRRCLDLCRDEDLLNPSASSIIARYFHGNCLHAGGQTRLSWILLGEALRIAQAMRLYDETAYADLDEIEARLRRHIFWQLYTSDKSAAFLNDKHFTMHQFVLGDSMTVDEPDSAGLMLLSSCSYSERMIIIGFNLCQKFFYHASELMFHMRYAAKQVDRDDPDPIRDISVSQRSNLIHSYVRLTTVLDEAPKCLQSFAGLDNANAGSPRDGSHLLSLQVQVANLLVTNNHLRMLVTQRCAEDGLQSILGLPQDTLLMDLRRSEIARDLVHVIRDAPFEALSINGEPLVTFPK